MNTDRLRLRRELVAFLHATRPCLAEAMKATRQVAPGTVSPYHLEDGVWTHTMMAMQAALDREDFSVENVLCALVHDFAKPLTAVLARPSPERRKISFPDHGPLGTQAAVDFLAALMDARPDLVSGEDVARIAFCVSRHIAFYYLTDAEDALRYCNDDPALCESLARLLYCDMQGSVADPERPHFAPNVRLLEDLARLLPSLPPAEEPEDGPGLRLFCGPSSANAERFVAESLGGRDPFVLPGGADGPALRRWLVRKAKAVEAEIPLGAGLRGELATAESREALVRALDALFPGVPRSCVFLLSPSDGRGDPELPACSTRSGLKEPAERLVLPSLLDEPGLGRVRTVYAG